MKTLSFLFITFFLFTGIVQSQTTWVPFTNNQPSKPKLTVQSSTNQVVHYLIEIPGMNQELLTNNGESYQRLSILGGQKWGDPGYPEIPSIGKLLAIPECSGMTISIVINDSLIFDGYNVYPSPVIIEDTSGGNPHLEEAFVKNDSIYGLNHAFPRGLYESEDGGYLRSQKVLKLSAFPFRYNPLTQQLVVYTRFEVTIQFQNPQSDVTVNNGYFNRLTKSTLLN